MEGLIPMVLKTLKKTKTRRQYKSLSSGAAQTYDIANFYPNGHNHQFVTPTGREKTSDGFHAQSNGHRRHKSLNSGDYAGGFSPEDAIKSKQLVRFRSHRIFSCVTGA